MHVPVESLFTNHAVFLLSLAALSLALLLKMQRKPNESRAGSNTHDTDPVEIPYRPVLSFKEGQDDFFHAMTNRLSLRGQVSRAIESSLQANRVIGVVVIRNPRLMEAFEREEMDATVETLSIIREIVSRPHFLHISNSEIAVFVPQLKLRASLETLAEELQRNLSGFGVDEKGRANCASGTAMYPIDGYDAEALLASAKSKLETKLGMNPGANFGASVVSTQIRKAGKALHFELTGSKRTVVKLPVSRENARVMAH